MNLDFHCHRFDWAGGPSGIGPGVAELAQRAEALGVRTLSFMDHWFQMDWMAPAEDAITGSLSAAGVDRLSTGGKFEHAHLAGVDDQPRSRVCSRPFGGFEVLSRHRPVREHDVLQPI